MAETSSLLIYSPPAFVKCSKRQSALSRLLFTAGIETSAIPVMLACKGMADVSVPDCEAGTAPAASDRSAAGAADVRSTDGLWPAGAGP